jgi:hypothetical protein
VLTELSSVILKSSLTMSTEPLDIRGPLVDGLSHISLVANNSDVFYSTVQFYESLGFQTVAVV